MRPIPVLIESVALGAFLLRAPLRQWHHAYLGVALFAFGGVFGNTTLQYVGAGVTADDAIEHLWGPSLLRWAYGKTLWRIPLVRRLNAALDRWLA